MRLYDYAASGNCYKVRLLLALLGREHDRVPVDIFAGETLTPEYEAINPARETPVLELEDGTFVAQSNANPSVTQWLDRLRQQPGFVDDLLPYPDNARPGRGSSVYDE